MLLMLVLPATYCCKAPARAVPPPLPEEENGPLPALTGRMVYHSYTSYGDMDSKMFIYDFSSDRLTEISRGWTVVTHPMNGHFSPDGRYITFMGIGAGTGSWDIFLYDTQSSAQPLNLTSDGFWRDEDPKFSFDGKRICFKRDNRLSEIDVMTGTIRVLQPAGGTPYSMPYYTVDGTKMLFGGGWGQDAFIGLWDITTSTMTSLYDRPGVVEYYPVTIDEVSFYYTAHISATNHYDQLYRGYFNGAPPTRLAFNSNDGDYSDACPVSGAWLILSSTRPGSRGGYDLYIAHGTSGDIYPLSMYNDGINTTKNELGADYVVDTGQ